MQRRVFLGLADKARVKYHRKVIPGTLVLKDR